ncbi:serpentine type 7TM GPCR chemoreceptor srv domain-containing protein [Ditylenchus destructor]|uniref:Serpentine type 7TM GPCR chemoreceptor srv domain-containing protein n=1 Tax=Ditylenchus destructor TaxID=166010 RepID=A0AAD4MUA6_9BILA|nr:serpentine type 7TM GPCR chemoreceptor srv domain-containing protein [Ditylenchus destructor]
MDSNLHMASFQAITNSEYAASSSIIFCIVCAFLNTATLLAYSRQRRHTLDRTEEHRIELRLTIYTFFTFLAQLAMAIYMIFVTIGTAYSMTIFVATLNQSPLLSDLCTVAMPSWLLLWASRNVRELVLNYVPEFSSIKLRMCSRKVTPCKNISLVRISVRSVVSPSHMP